MKAVITKDYGSVDVLSIESVDKPTINDNEILVEVKAVSINPIDWRIRTGEMRMITGRIPPRILGADYSGVVNKIGKNITSYKKGDEVYGLINNAKVKEGTYADFVKVKESEICLKPNNCSFEEAASLPLVSLTAYLAIVNTAKVKKGSNILINGCTGGVGSVAVQIAKALGCNVTGICSSKNFDFARKLGTDKMIDYKKNNVLEKTEIYDTIFDTVGNLKFSKSKKILRAKEVYVTTAATFTAILFTPIFNLFRSKKSKVIIANPNSDILTVVKQMVETGKIKSKISKTFDFEQIKEAHKMSQNGGFCGKIVLKV